MRNILFAILLVLLIGGCGAGTQSALISDQTPGVGNHDQEQSSLPAVPPLDYHGKAFTPDPATRAASGVITIPLDNPDDFGQAPQGSDTWHWERIAVTYSNDPNNATRPVQLAVTGTGAAEYWIGLSDYSTRTYRFFSSVEAASLALNTPAAGHSSPERWVSVKTDKTDTATPSQMHLVIMVKNSSVEEALGSVTVTEKLASDASYNVPIPPFVENSVTANGKTTSSVKPQAVTTSVGWNTAYKLDDPSAPDFIRAFSQVATMPAVSKVPATVTPVPPQYIHVNWTPLFDPADGLNYPSNMHLRIKQVNGDGSDMPGHDWIILGYNQYYTGEYVIPTDYQGTFVTIPGATYVVETSSEIPGHERSHTDDGGPTQVPLMAPTIFQVSRPAAGPIAATWHEAYGAESYHIFRSDNPETPIATVDDNPDGDDNTWEDDSEVPANQVLSYWVTSVNSYTESDPSPASSVGTFQWTNIDFGVTGLTGSQVFATENNGVIVGGYMNDSSTLKFFKAITNTPTTVSDFGQTDVLTKPGFNLLGCGVYSNGKVIFIGFDPDGFVSLTSTTDSPTGPSDWGTPVVIDANATSVTCAQLKMFSDHPCIAYVDSVMNDVNLAVPTANPPQDGDWSAYFLWIYPVTPNAVSLTSSSGKIVVGALIPEGAGYLDIYHAQNEAPSWDQWDPIYKAKDGILGSTLSLDSSGTRIDTWVGESTQMSHSYQFGTADAPTQTSDWSFSQAASASAVVQSGSLAELDGVPVAVGTCTSATQFFAAASAPAPPDPTPWINGGIVGTGITTHLVVTPNHIIVAEMQQGPINPILHIAERSAP